MNNKGKSLTAGNSQAQNESEGSGCNSIYIKQPFVCSPSLKKMKFVKTICNRNPFAPGGNEKNSIHQLSYNQIDDDNNAVLTGYNNLLVFDFDGEDGLLYEYIKTHMPETMIVKTGNNLYWKKHYYYYCENLESKTFRGENGNVYLEFIGLNKSGGYKCISAPGSYHHETGNQYRIENDKEIKWLSIEEYNSIIDRVKSFPHIKPEKKVIPFEKKPYDEDNIFDYIKSNIGLYEYVSSKGYKPDGNKQIKCLFHSEKTPSLTFYQNSNSAYCFGCKQSFNIIDFILHFEGITTKETPKWFEENYQKEYKKFEEQKGKNEMVEYNNDVDKTDDSDDVLYNFPNEVITGIAKTFVEAITDDSEKSPIHTYFSFLTCW